MKINQVLIGQNEEYWKYIQELYFQQKQLNSLQFFDNKIIGMQTQRNFLYVKQQTELNSKILKNANYRSQIFYSQSSNNFFLNDFNLLYKINNSQTVFYDLQIRIAIKYLAYNQKLNILCYTTQIASESINFCWLNDRKFTILKHSKQNKQNILFFEWIKNPKSDIDFFVVDLKGIKFYKIQQDKKTIKEAKIISIKIECCWYDTFSSILVCKIFSQKGKVHIYHLNNKSISIQKKIIFELHYDDFLDQEKKESLLMEFIRKLSKNEIHQDEKIQFEPSFSTKPLFTELKRKNVKLILRLFNIYSSPFLLFYNSSEQKIKIYEILKQNLKQVYINIRLPYSECLQLNVYDNLLIITLNQDRLSYIYDIKRPHLHPIITQIQDNQQNYSKKSYFRFLFRGQWVIQSNKIIKRLGINLRQIFQQNNEGEVLLFMMRRSSNKNILLEWLTQNIFKIKQLDLSQFWKYTFKNYENKQKREYQQSQLKLLISPLNLFDQIFQYHYINSPDNHPRLLQIVLECARNISQFHLKIPQPFQDLILKLLLKYNKYTLLSQLVQIRFFQDSKQMAYLLLNHCKQPEFELYSQILEQLAIDIFYRREQFRDIVSILINKSLFQQGIRLMKKNWTKFNPKQLQTLINQIKQAQNKNKLMKYVLQQYVKQYWPGNKLQINEQ